MKKYFILAAAALAFAACSNKEDFIAEPQAEQQVVEMPVAFDVYVNRATTRAGVPGEVTTANLKTTSGDMRTAGFGVFGYYTDGENYSGVTKPNFFYNQQVTSNGTNFTYSPLKYWPNEFGSDAISDQADRVSLFAYAPWVKVDPLTGVVNGDTPIKNTENITGMTRNNAIGDPFVKYTATMDATNSVDLCWGVAAGTLSSVGAAFTNDHITAGKPYVDVVKPEVDGKINFDFKHALAKLNVQIDADVDKAAHDETNTVSDFTKIWVRSVTFEGITLKGALNLRTGEWYQIDASGDNKISSGSVTVYDGRKDGKEPMGTAANEAPASLNPALVQSLPYDASDLATALQTTSESTVTGVTYKPQNLFKKTTDETDPIYVIPTGEPMKVTIVYDVETYDPNLAYYLSDGVTLGSTIQNSITKTITGFSNLSAGTAYTLKLHLGMTSVTFDASVSSWGSATDGSAFLPVNIE